MEKDIEIFKNSTFGEVRVTEVNGEPMFCLADVCRALDLRQGDVRQRLEDGVVSTQPIVDGLGREQQANFVNEDGLYDVILDSRKQEAKAFRKWVTHDVLPSIRKTGQYKTSKSAEKESKEIEIKEKELRIEEAKLYWEMSKSGKFLPKYSQVLGVYAANSLSGNNTIPLPVLEKKRYKAGDIAKMLGTSGKKIGMIAKANNLKTEEYGEWVEDKSRFSNKQTPNFEYYENAIPLFKNLLNY